MARKINSGAEHRCQLRPVTCFKKSVINFPPMIIFKGTATGTIASKELPQEDCVNDYPGGIVYATQDSSWNDHRTMLLWVQQVWEPWWQKNNMKKC